MLFRILLRIGILLISIAITLNVFASKDKIKILSTSVPVASLVSMIGGEYVDIQNFKITGGCIHHFHMTPKDLEIVDSTDLLIYVSEKFESFVTKLHPKNKLAILDKNMHTNNMHIWLDIESTKFALEKIEQKLTSMLPNQKGYFKLNLKKATSRIKDLEKEITTIILRSRNCHLITISTEIHAFLDHFKIQYLYKNPANISESNQIIDLINKNDYYILLTEHNKGDKLKKFIDKKKIIYIETENWNFFDKSELPDLYFKEMLKISEKIHE